MSVNKWQVLVDRPMTLLTGDTLTRALDNMLLGVPFDNGMIFAAERGQPIERIAHRNDLTNKIYDWEFEKLEEYVKSGNSVCKKLLHTEYKPIGNTKTAIDRYLKLLAELAPYMYAIFSIEEVIETRLKKLLPSKVHVEDVLNNPYTPSDSNQFQLDVLRAATSGFSVQKIDKIAKSCSYMGLTNHLDSSILSAQEVLKISKNIADPKLEIARLKSHQIAQKKAYDKNLTLLSDEAKKYLSLLHKYQQFRDERIKTYKLVQNRFLKPVVEDVCCESGIKFNDLIWYTVEELAYANKKQVDVTKRKTKFFVLNVTGELRYGLTSPINQNDENENLQGRCAQKGYAKGVVCKVYSIGDANNLREGEILVTTMTTPDLVPAMKKAAAIVTDEGGVLCHAAIISRELGKPCVIGTRFATKKLKNGDVIEVFAEEGRIVIETKS